MAKLTQAASKRLIWILSVLAGCVVIDQVSKYFATGWFTGRAPIILLGDLFRFQYAENEGAFLSLGSQLQESVRFWIFTVIVGLVLVVCLYVLLRDTKAHWMQSLAFALLVGGGISNLIDRILRPQGRVIDFMNMGIGSLRTGIFNVADMAIMAGIFLILIRVPFQSSEKTR